MPQATQEVTALTDDRRRLLARMIAKRNVSERPPPQNPSPVPFIRRRAAPVEVGCVVAATQAELRRLVDELEAGYAGGCFVADLSLGGWRPHQIAAEFASQLGRPLRQGHYGTRTNAEASSAGDPSTRQIGNWIDDEARGDTSVRTGAEMAAELLATCSDASPCAFLVIAPRFGIDWRSENEMFLHFFAQGIEATGGKLLLVLADPEPPKDPRRVQVRWPTVSEIPEPRRAGSFHLFPGAIPPVIARKWTLEPGLTVALKTGHQIVAPEARHSPDTVSADAYAGLLAGLPPTWLRAYVSYFSHVDESDGRNRAHTLSTAAWGAFRLASPDIAVALQQRAVKVSVDSAQRGGHLVALQTMRLVLSHYAALAEAPEVEDAPKYLRDQLTKLRAWGCMMSGQATEAISRMESVVSESGFSETNWVDLYLRNIYALMRFRNGDWEGALGHEQEIEKQLDARTSEIWHMRYVNCINQARLYRSRKRFDRSELYFRRAFGVTDGVRIPNDAFYAAFCWAGLCKAAGRTQDAYRAWLRSALHWLANPLPEAMAWRFAIAVVGAYDHRAPWTPEGISEALHGSLLDAASAAGYAPDLTGQNSEEAPNVLHASLATVPQLEGAMGVGAPGWGAIWTPGRLSMPFEGPQHARLRALVAQLMRKSCPSIPEVADATIVVDDQLGRDLPVELEELLSVCLRHGIGAAAWGERHLEINGPRRERLLTSARLAMGPGVATTDDQGFVRFKRHLPARKLLGFDCELVAAARSGQSVGEVVAGRGPGATIEDVSHRVFDLVRAHVLTLTIPEV